MGFLDSLAKRWPQWFGGSPDYKVLITSVDIDNDNPEFTVHVTVKNEGTGYGEGPVYVNPPGPQMSSHRVALQSGQSESFELTFDLVRPGRSDKVTDHISAWIEDVKDDFPFSFPRDRYIYVADDPESFEAKVGYLMFEKWRDGELKNWEFRQGTSKGYGFANLEYSTDASSNVTVDGDPEDILSRSTNASSVLYN